MDTKKLYEVVKSGNIQELNSLLKNDLNNGAHFLAKCLEEMTLRRVPISYEMHKNCVAYLVEHRDITEISASKEKINSARIELLNYVIDQVLKRPNVVDDTLLQLFKYIYRNIFILKNQLLSTYDRIPWEEVEFLLTIYVYAQTKSESIGKYFMLSFNHQKLINYLQIFKDKLSMIRASAPSGKILLQERNIIVQKLEVDFDDMYQHFHLMRTVYSLAHISERLLILKDIDIHVDQGKYALRRLLQITGEYCKNSLQSPNIFDTIFEINTTKPHSQLQEIFKSFKKLRDHLSYFRLSSTIDMDYAEMHSQLQYFAEIVEFILIAKRYEIVATTQPVNKIGNILSTICETDQLSVPTIRNIILNCNNEEVVTNMYFLFEYIAKDKNVNELKTLLKDAHTIIYNPKVKHNVNIQKVIYNIIDQAMDFNHVRKCNETIVSKGSYTPHLDEIKMSIIKEILGEHSYTTFTYDLYLQTAIEKLVFDLLDVSTNRTHDDRFYLDKNYPIIFDKALRNQIAFDNLILVECSTRVSIYVTALKFAEGTMQEPRTSNTELDLKTYFGEMEERYRISKDILKMQSDFYEACKNGTKDNIINCIKNGADPDGKNMQGFTALHIASIGDNEIVFNYIKQIKTSVPPHKNSSFV